MSLSRNYSVNVETKTQHYRRANTARVNQVWIQSIHIRALHGPGGPRAGNLRLKMGRAANERITIHLRTDSSRTYEGRPINKLQKGIILLIVKIWKIRNIPVGFVHNLILYNSCEFYYDDVTVTSFVNDKYVDATAESIP